MIQSVKVYEKFNPFLLFYFVQSLGKKPFGKAESNAVKEKSGRNQKQTTEH